MRCCARVPDAPVLTSRQDALLRGAAQWRDAGSEVRREARALLTGGQWPAQVVEEALDAVLLDADAAIAAWERPACGLRVLAILPGNIIGPAVAAAYCAGAAGATLMLKSSSREIHLADIVARQFDRLGEPLAGTLHPMRWSGGDADFEATVFMEARRIVAFGDDATIADVKRRAPDGTTVIAYGSAYSIGFVAAGAELGGAAHAAAYDVALFDQRGCLSPQTIYVEGDESHAIVFGHALSVALHVQARRLPRASSGDAERAAVAEFVRRLQVSALVHATHALGTVFVGQDAGGVPEHVVGVEPFSAPTCAGFGRLVIVKPCYDAGQAAHAAGALGHRLDSVGVFGKLAPGARKSFESAGALRVCGLGEMQKPPLGYRPKIADFA